MEIKTISNSTKKYTVFGIIATCLGKDYRSIKSRVSKYYLEVDEVLDKDPWMAILCSQAHTSISESKLRELASDYRLDPDGKNVPYYFCAKDLSNGKEYVIFNNKFELIPINTKEEKENAVKIGINLGLVEDQLDF